MKQSHTLYVFVKCETCQQKDHGIRQANRRGNTRATECLLQGLRSIDIDKNSSDFTEVTLTQQTFERVPQWLSVIIFVNAVPEGYETYLVRVRSRIRRFTSVSCSSLTNDQYY